MAALASDQRQPHEILGVDRPALLDALRSAVDGAEPLRSILRFHLGFEDERGPSAPATGKLLRPCLVLFIGEQLRAEPAGLMHAAVSLELAHAFSLIHDDIQDEDRTRRGHPSVWARFGVPQAINAGDLLYALAVFAALRASEAVATRLTHAVIEMIQGQAQDLEFEDRWPTAGDYLQMVDRKTGSLLRCAFELGALAGRADPELVSTLSAAGHAVGRAFQIQDDILGIWGDDQLLGKEIGSDIRRRKKSLPIVLLSEQLDGEDAADLQNVYEATSLADEQVRAVVSRLDACGIRERCETLAQQHARAAGTAIGSLALPDDARARLAELAAFLVTRQR